MISKNAKRLKRIKANKPRYIWINGEWFKLERGCKYTIQMNDNHEAVSLYEWPPTWEDD
jgi:hypothetical protein